jgi:glycosyltransferase involved in cell wall biosynthesis
MGNKLFIIESYNFISKPIGGQAIFSLNMLHAYKDDIFLIGWADSNEPVGEIVYRYYEGEKIKLFTIAKRKNKKDKYFIPSRILTLVGLFRFRKKIKNLGITSVFTSAPEALFFLTTLKDIKIYFRMAGLNNPIQYSKYKYLRIFFPIYNLFFRALIKKIDLLLATADDKDIDNFRVKNLHYLTETKIIQFPTRVNTNIFHSNYDKKKLRELKKIDLNKKVIITVGRLAFGKGWKLMIDSFIKFKKVYPESILIFIGSGEEKQKICDYIAINNLNDEILLLGRKEPTEISEYLNLSDLFIMASYREGWSTTLLEALSCNKPVCVTNFSSAKTLVKNGVNGYVVEDRKPEIFKQYMLKAINLEVNNSKLIEKYSLNNLKKNLDECINEFK